LQLPASAAASAAVPPLTQQQQEQQQQQHKLSKNQKKKQRQRQKKQAAAVLQQQPSLDVCPSHVHGTFSSIDVSVDDSIAAAGAQQQQQDGSWLLQEPSQEDSFVHDEKFHAAGREAEFHGVNGDLLSLLEGEESREDVPGARDLLDSPPKSMMLIGAGLAAAAASSGSSAGTGGRYSSSPMRLRPAAAAAASSLSSSPGAVNAAQQQQQQLRLPGVAAVASRLGSASPRAAGSPRFGSPTRSSCSSIKNLVQAQQSRLRGAAAGEVRSSGSGSPQRFRAKHAAVDSPGGSPDGAAPAALAVSSSSEVLSPLKLVSGGSGSFSAGQIDSSRQHASDQGLPGWGSSSGSRAAAGGGGVAVASVDAAAELLSGGGYGGRRRARWNSQQGLDAAAAAGVGGEVGESVEGGVLRASDEMALYRSSVQWRALSDSLAAASEPLPAVSGGLGAVISPGSGRLVAAVAAAAAVGSGGGRAVEGDGLLVAVDPSTSQEWKVAENLLYFE
jgi:hypothetical protein